MRIVFTVRIAPVITKADVSYNAMFIGLWTEVECTLGFVVACALCLPKLIQAKGKKLKRAMSKASTPFSSFKSSVSNISRSGTFGASRSGTFNQSRQDKVNKSDDDYLSSKAKGKQKAVEPQEQPEPRFVEMGHLQQSPPTMSEEFELPRDQRCTVWGLPSSSSSMYSQSMVATPGLSREPSTRRLAPAPLNVPKASSSDIYENLRSPTNRITKDYMSADQQLQAEVEMLKSFRFEPRKESMENLAIRRKSIPHLNRHEF